MAAIAATLARSITELSLDIYLSRLYVCSPAQESQRALINDQHPSVRGFAVSPMGCTPTSRAENRLRKMRKMRKFGSAVKGGTPEDVSKSQSHTGEG
jgi:hypothetical protein